MSIGVVKTELYDKIKAVKNCTNYLFFEIE